MARLRLKVNTRQLDTNDGDAASTNHIRMKFENVKRALLLFNKPSNNLLASKKLE